MHLLTRRSRNATVLAALAAAVPFATATTSQAAPLRATDTSSHTHADYLKAALGLPASETNPALQPVTYDRFQWILRQPGKFAVLIGDPATDPSFAARAQDVEAAADASGAKNVYWFNPNLSGNAKVGATVEPALDIRNPGAINIAPRSQTIYGNAWLNLVGEYLGNGVTTAGRGTGTVTATTGTPDRNDAGATPGQSTEVGNPSGGALYDYAAGAIPADLRDSFFLVYDKDRTVGGQAGKIAAWVNLTDAASPAAAKADVTTALGNGASLSALDEYAWWKGSTNEKQSLASNDQQGKNVPVVTDADGDPAEGGWRVAQLTYPELVHLLESETGKEAVILFGGTWCPNTRPVISQINRYAQKHGVTVFNFDTILDGGVVGGGNATLNPLQVRNVHTYTPTGQAPITNSTPSYIYGDLVAQYLGNLKTEYNPETGANVTYYPQGGTGPSTKINRLQVPYLFGYQGQDGEAPHGGVKRQWIQTNENGSYTEYMSQHWWTRPTAGQLNITAAQLPQSAPIWQTLNQQVAAYTWQTDLATVRVNSAVTADADQYLVAGDKAKLTYTPEAGVATKVDVAFDAAGTVAIDPAALTAALSALGAGAPTGLVAAKTALLAAKEAAVDAALVTNLETVVGAWGVLETRKNRINTVWGAATNPNSIAGGVAAIRAAELFFEGLPDAKPVVETPNPGVTNPPAVTPIAAPAPAPAPAKLVAVKAKKIAGTSAKAPTRTKAGTYKIMVTAAPGRAAATGKVTVKLKKGKTSKTLKGTLKNGVVTLKVPKLAKGTWKVTISWVGDANYTATRISGKAIKVKK